MYVTVLQFKRRCYAWDSPESLQFGLRHTLAHSLTETQALFELSGSFASVFTPREWGSIHRRYKVSVSFENITKWANRERGIGRAPARYHMLTAGMS